MHITIIGFNKYHGSKPFSLGGIIKLLKEPNNKYDTEAISCEMRYFRKIEYIANSTRLAKEHASRNNNQFQEVIWNSIDVLEEKTSVTSPTSTMSESYDHVKIDHIQLVNSFKNVPGESGALIIINGEIKGFEIFLNSEIYKECHEKSLKVI